MKAGKGGRPENYKQVRWKLQSDRLNVFQKTILLVFLEVILLVLLEMTVLVFLEMILVHVTRNEFCADDDSRNEPTMYFDTRNGRCAEVDFQQDDETFLDVQTDGVTLPVPCSSSSFSLGSVVVVGPRENVCSDMKFESDGGTDDSKPEPLAKSAEVKRLVGIAVASGTPIRVAYKDVRRRMRIEARRQKELDEGVEPEVVLDSFLDQVKVEEQQQSGLLKRVPFDSFCQSCQTSSCEGQEIA